MRARPLIRPGILRGLLASEAAGGRVLMVSAALALVIANSPLAGAYFGLLHLPLAGLDLLHWINDGLMAGFFLLVGLEIKRELVEGELSRWSERMLPAAAALGGMVVPALIYLLIQGGRAQTAHGWAIPAATDIAFALGVLALAGPRVPVSLKILLTALAIIDDLGAVLIIAVFYSHGLNLWALAGAGLVLAVLAVLGALRVTRLWPYLVLGPVLWWLTLRSGIHATVAGVALAATIPLSRPGRGADLEKSPLHRLEHWLQPWVAFLVAPVFGLANAGVSLASAGPGALTAPVPAGIALGLFLGKQMGVFGACWLCIRLGLARLPDRASWLQLYGVSVLCGVGFTMSLFIGLLAFAAPILQDQAKIGVLAGSIASALAGLVILRLAPATPARRTKAP